MALKVMRDQVDGWDVVRGDEALSNFPDRESAEAAARMRAEEDHDREPVEVDIEHVHEIDDTRQGMRPAFIGLVALLAVVTILVAIISLTDSLTGFGS